MSLKRFSISSTQDAIRGFSERELESQVVVVALVGRTVSDDSAVSDVPNVLDDIDDLILTLGSPQQEPSFNMEDFDCYLDPSEGVVYVSLIGPGDNALQRLSSDPHFREQVQNHSFLSSWTAVQVAYARALLFIVSVSHIVLFVNPGHTFNLKTIQLFKVLSFARGKYQSCVTKTLSVWKDELPEEWATQGRLTAPRLLVLFRGCPHSILQEADKSEQISKIKKLEHSLEDLIYGTLRQSRVVKDMCNRALFSIAPNEEFVFVGLNMSRRVWSLETEPGSTECLNELSAVGAEDVAGSTGDWDEVIRLPQTSPPSEDEIFERREPSQTPHHLFKDFVLRHVRKAHGEGFSDNMGKFSNVRSSFQVPGLRCWLKTVQLILQSPESGLGGENGTSALLEKLLGTEVTFSTTRCKKVFPLAVAVYQEGLAPHYSQLTHEKQLRRAVSVVRQHARGPAQGKYLGQLKEECERIWKSGRQSCEALSLNRNPCTKPRHISFSSSPSLHQLGDSEHWSGVQFYSSCNCGFKQAPRQDPFTLRAANFDFYQIIGQECGCIHYEKVNFPVFQPSTSDYREAELGSREAGCEPACEPPEERSHIPELQDLHLVSPSLSTGKVWTCGAGDGRPVAGQESALSLPSLSTPLFENQSNPPINYYNTTTHTEKQLVRQASTTEYLPGMIHLESPPGLLPQFSSWSLLCRGPSSLYSHNIGLADCPGFISSSAFLLPWDITLRDKELCKPEGWDGSSKAAQQPVQILRSGNRRNHRPPKEFLSVKIFLGIEYECVRGHRFMSSAPGVVHKANPYGGNTKEDALKFTEGNMPLYVPCPCGKIVAQLMRVHIVTPKAPVTVTVDPRIRPAPPPSPVFVPGFSKPIQLSQSAYWVLRLPYVYASERKVFNMPSRLKSLRYGELLGPIFGISIEEIRN